MPERVFRLVLAGIMVVTLFLPFQPVSAAREVPNWLFILYASVETSVALLSGPRTTLFPVRLVNWFDLLSRLSLLSVLFLIPFNILLAVCPFERLKTWLRIAHRLALLVLVVLTWRFTFIVAPVIRGVGFWANTAVISIAALVEVIFLISQGGKGSQNASPTVG
jgi:hypothetical protein